MSIFRKTVTRSTWLLSLVATMLLIAPSSMLPQSIVSASATPPTLLPGVVYPTGATPYSVAAVDINNDSYPDLIVANTLGNTVSVLINNGDGIFAPKVDYPTGTGPVWVVASDVNGDAHPDLAVTNQNSNNVSVLINNGNGTFAPKVDYPTGQGSDSVAVADLDGDGHPDLAVTNPNSNKVSVLMNNGNGTFASKVDYPTGSFPDSVTAVDLNGDGHVELAVANWLSDTVSVLINNGNGTFAPKVDYPTRSLPDSVTAVDLNGNGYPDLVVGNANSNSNTVSVLLNYGNGTFAPKVDYPTGNNPLSVAMADFNGDSCPDLVVANQGSNTVSVLLNYGNGTFAPKVDYLTGTAPTSVAVADLNSDGYPDIAVANTGSNTVSVLLSNGKAVVPPKVVTPVPEMKVEGNSIKIADGDSSPSATDHTDFGDALIDGGTVVRTFTIKNTGTGDLILSSDPKVAISGAHADDFNITIQPSSLVAEAGSTTFRVTFNPSSTGVRTAILSIANDDIYKNPYDFSIQGTGKAVLTVSGITASNKAYDGNTIATLDTSNANLAGVVGGDKVTMSVASAIGVFTDKNVGTGKMVTISGLTIRGADASNYSLTQPITTANIIVRAIAVRATNETKAYDGSTSSSGIPTITVGSLAAGDKVTLTQSFDTRNIGIFKTLTPAGIVNDGNSGKNYNVTFVNVGKGIVYSWVIVGSIFGGVIGSLFVLYGVMSYILLRRRRTV